MKNRFLILAVDDEREVLDSVKRDLQPFAQCFEIDVAESADEALEAIQESEREGCPLALILCDHLMPGRVGVDLLVDLHGRSATRASKKILLTGQAGQEDTIRAVNAAHLDHYFAKPWEPTELQETLKTQLTDFVIANTDDPETFAAVLDQARIFQALVDRGDE